MVRIFANPPAIPPPGAPIGPRLLVPGVPELCLSVSTLGWSRRQCCINPWRGAGRVSADWGCNLTTVCWLCRLRSTSWTDIAALGMPVGLALPPWAVKNAERQSRFEIIEAQWRTRGVIFTPSTALIFGAPWTLFDGPEVSSLSLSTGGVKSPRGEKGCDPALPRRGELAGKGVEANPVVKCISSVAV